jgi:hypothetical protein
MGVPSAAGSWDAEDDFLLKNAVEVTAIEPSSTSRTSIGPYLTLFPSFPSLAVAQISLFLVPG